MALNEDINSDEVYFEENLEDHLIFQKPVCPRNCFSKNSHFKGWTNFSKLVTI